MRTKLIIAAGMLGLLASCHDPVDQAAKARIFSPEDPPKFVTRAAEDLGAETLGQDPVRVRRVLRMSAAEAAERLGPHAYSAQVTFTWTGAGKRIALDEKHSLQLGPDGDFSARLDTGDKLGRSKQGMEMVRAQGKVYARSRFGTFRERARDRGASARYEEDVYGVLRTFYDLFDGRLALSGSQPTTVEGRKALRYEVSLAEARPEVPPTEAPIPPPLLPKNGANAQLVHELELGRKREPRTLDGTITVDALSAVVLQAELKGTIEAPGEGQEKSLLALTAAIDTTAIGKDPALTMPEGALPDEARPQSIAAALTRFDLPRVGTGIDAGAPAKPDEPDDP